MLGNGVVACLISVGERMKEGSCYFAEYCEMHQVSAGRKRNEIVVLKSPRQSSYEMRGMAFAR